MSVLNSATLTGRPAALGLLAVAVGAGLISGVPAADGLALLAAASTAAVFAVPPRGRPLLGAAIVIAAAGVVTLGTDPDAAGWICIVVLGVAGVVTSVWGRSWPPLARRYDRQADAASAADPRDIWRALDRGEDPTGPAEPPPEGPP